ncbi:MAG TPA: creatininase family protein [Gemmatimonadaceae bacterium]|nr:creatininase family protein [Gemmatimonadaceae bacterium]
MPGRPYILAESSWTLVRQTMYDVAVLPWGATEAHNLHLPYATDTIQSEQIAAGAAQYAWGQGARVIVLPAVPFGVNTTQLDIRLTINMMPSTQLALLRDVASSLAGQGIQKLVLLNGHGGNDFRPLIRELHGNVDLFICAVDWYRCARPERIFDEPGDHAGELETSVMMHVAPELVLPLSDAGTGAARAFRISALREGWAWAPREWTRVTRDTGVGNPAHASADKGRRYAEAVTRQIGDFLVELAACDVADLYEPAPGPQAG